jgi:fructose-1,6-bisphosphatase I
MSEMGMTLSRHILEQGRRHPRIAGELSTLIAQLGFAAKTLAREMRRAALVGELGLVGDRNATGDAQKKLDIYANQTLVSVFGDTGLVAAVVSEEMEEVKHVNCGDDGRYVLCTDPLDGSSNTDINGPLATIFGFYRRAHTGTCATTNEVLRPGSEQILAGYILYSSSTVLVYTAGQGVHGFTLDHDLGEFLLSHPNIQCPKRGRSFSANLGHLREWGAGIRKYVDHVLDADTASGRPYSLRYSGALVADVHRILIEGGIYFYPADASHSQGKLRLMYECSPLGFVMREAGGSASTGREDVLAIPASSVHQRVPLVIGSTEEVALFKRFAAESSAGAAR